MSNKNKLGTLLKGVGLIAGAAGLVYAGYKASERVNEKLNERNIVLGVKDLVESIHQENRATLDFEKLVRGDWSEMFIFTPYTSYDDIFDTLNFIWEDVYKTNINTKDTINLLVFVNGDKVVNFMEYPKWYGDFGKLNSDMYIKENAKFELENKDGIITIHECIN